MIRAYIIYIHADKPWNYVPFISCFIFFGLDNLVARPLYIIYRTRSVCLFLIVFCHLVYILRSIYHQPGDIYTSHKRLTHTSMIVCFSPSRRPHPWIPPIFAGLATTKNQFDLYQLEWAPASTDAEYMDCFKDSKEDRVMGDNLVVKGGMTQAVCRDHCANRSAMYYGTQVPYFLLYTSTLFIPKKQRAIVNV